MFIRYFASYCTTLALLVSGCSRPHGSSAADKRNFVNSMKQDTLAKLYAARPDLRDRVSQAEGYAVFSDVNLHVLLLSAGSGYGVVVDNSDGHETYMRMAGLGTGFGAGLKDFRAVFVFTSRDSLRRFVGYGWEFGAGAEAGAIASDKGAEAGSRASTSTSGSTAGAGAQAGEDQARSSTRGFEVYQITQSGVSLSARIEGTKYWPDKALNND